MKTSIPTTQQQQDRKWFIVDATGLTLGRMASRVADILRGKHKPQFTPHMDMGDNVIIINIDKIAVSGTKLDHKNYYTHSGHVGHLKVRKLGDMLSTRPLKVIEQSIRGMLPKNKLRDVFMSKLHLYEGAEHQHEAQKPEALSL